MMQTCIDFENILHTRENLASNEVILNGQIKRLSNNCYKIYQALMRGERLTGATIVSKYNILEYRRRLKELKDFGVDINEVVLFNGAKQWWIDK